MTSKPQAHSEGVLSWLAMISDTHNRLTVGDFMQQLKLGLHTGRIELLCRGDKPVAWLLWQHPSKIQWQQLLAAHPSAAVDANTLQGQVWLNFWVRPFGCDDKLAQAVRQVLQSKGLSPAGLNWHDPSAKDGQGALHLNVLWQKLQGM